MRRKLDDAVSEAWATQYRELFFGTKNGPEVFAHMLMTLGVFDIHDPADIRANEARNFGIWLMDLTGLSAEHNYENAIKAMISSRLPEPIDTEDE